MTSVRCFPGVLLNRCSLIITHVNRYFSGDQHDCVHGCGGNNGGGGVCVMLGHEDTVTGGGEEQCNGGGKKLIAW